MDTPKNKKCCDECRSDKCQIVSYEEHEPNFCKNSTCPNCHLHAQANEEKKCCHTFYGKCYGNCRDAWADIEEEFCALIKRTGLHLGYKQQDKVDEILSFLKKHIEKARLQGKYDQLAAHRKSEAEAYETGYQQGREETLTELPSLVGENGKLFSRVIALAMSAPFPEVALQHIVQRVAEKYKVQGFQAGSEAFKAKAIATVPKEFVPSYPFEDDFTTKAYNLCRQEVLDALNALSLTETPE